MTKCSRCGAEVPDGAKFCVMCGARIGAAGTAAAEYGTSTLTGSGLVVAISTAAISTVIVVGIIVLAQSFLA